LKSLWSKIQNLLWSWQVLNVLFHNIKNLRVRDVFVHDDDEHMSCNVPGMACWARSTTRRRTSCSRGWSSSSQVTENNQGIERKATYLLQNRLPNVIICERRFTDRRTVEFQITKHRINKRHITEFRKLSNIEIYRTSRIHGKMAHFNKSADLDFPSLLALLVISRVACYFFKHYYKLGKMRFGEIWLDFGWVRRQSYTLL
jgi:hypothetical protein